METESELEVFQKAANYVKAIANNLDSSQLLYFYARFKQINEGVCDTPKPGFFEFQAKQKWQAWKDLGTKSREDCVVEYVSQLSGIDPEWEVKISEGKVKPKSGLGVGVSTLVNEEDDDIPDDKKTLHDWVKEGQVERVCDLLEVDSGLVSDRDEDGMTALHWACDRGSVLMVQTLLKYRADINAQDIDGQTPLHYGTSCEHGEVVKTLLEHNADCRLCDNNGDLPETDSEEIRELLQQQDNVYACLCVSV